MLGIVAFSTFTGAATGCIYGKNPSERRDSVVTRIDELTGFLDRVGQFPVEAGARFAVGLAADLCFGNPLWSNLTPEGFQAFTDMCRKVGISESAISKLIQGVPH